MRIRSNQFNLDDTLVPCSYWKYDILLLSFPPSHLTV